MAHWPLGTAINGSEHFAVTYQAKDVLLTVVSGATPVDAGFVPGRSLGAQDRAERDLRPTLTRFDSAFRSALAVSTRVPSRMNHTGFGGRVSLHRYGRSGRARGSVQFSLLNLRSMPVLSFTAD